MKTKSRPLIGLLAIALLWCWRVPLNAQTAPQDGRYFERQAVQAYRNKDFPAYLANLQRALALRPNHPRLLYNLAGGYALNGKTEEGLQSLARVAAMGLAYPFEQDDDLASLRETESYRRVSEQFARNRAPLIRSEAAFTIPQKGLIGESVVFDPKTRSFYVASVRQRKIIKVGATGRAEDFATEKDGLWSVFGLKIDARRRLLWACTTATPQMWHQNAADKGLSGLLKFDLRTGRLLQKYVIADRANEHWLGDLTLTRNGDVYATDSVKPAIYLLRAGGGQIEKFYTHDSFVNLQGLAFSPDERRLFVADYAQGVWAIDMQTKQTELLAAPPDTTMLGLDGIYFYRNRLLAVQNGVNPQRVVEFELSKDWRRVERLNVLEANHPAHDELTLGALNGNDFYYIANAQWWSVNDDGQEITPEKLQNLKILRLRLP